MAMIWLDAQTKSRPSLVAASAVGRLMPVACFVTTPAGVIFLLKGATESRNGGLALFPEILKSELREVRSVIEAHSRSAELADMRHGNANGIGFDKGKAGFEYLLRVTSKGQTVDYKLDRWD